jgi:hypothetical protein
MDQAWAGYTDGVHLLSIERQFHTEVYYSTAEIAIIARCSTEHVRRALRNGTLRGTQGHERGHWVVRGEECRAWISKGRPSGQ